MASGEVEQLRAIRDFAIGIGAKQTKALTIDVFNLNLPVQLVYRRTRCVRRLVYLDFNAIVGAHVQIGL